MYVMKCIIEVYNLKAVTSEATHSKGLTKLAIVPNYRCPQMLFIALQPRQKLGKILVKEVVFKIEVTKK